MSSNKENVDPEAPDIPPAVTQTVMQLMLFAVIGGRAQGRAPDVNPMASNTWCLILYWADGARSEYYIDHMGRIVRNRDVGAKSPLGEIKGGPPSRPFDPSNQGTA